MSFSAVRLLAVCLRSSYAHRNRLKGSDIGRRIPLRWSSRGRAFSENAAGVERIALLIDGDQISPSAFHPLMGALSMHGEVCVRRFYSVQHKGEVWKHHLEKHDITPVVVPRYKAGKRETNDMSMALDAAELALKRQSGQQAITAIAVASQDTDFLLLLSRVQKWGVKGYIAILTRSGTTHCVSKHLWDEANITVVPYTAKMNLQDTYTLFHNNSIRVERLRTDRIEYVEYPAYQEALSELKSLKYLPNDAELITMDAVIKFYFENKLGPCTISPPWLMEKSFVSFLASAHKEAVQDAPVPYVFKPDPGNLVVINRLAAGNTVHDRQIKGGGPIVLPTTNDLVCRVLYSLGYLDSKFENLEDAMSVFVEVNQKFFGAEKLDMLSDASECLSRQMILHNVFVTPNIQTWRVMLSDKTARATLYAAKTIQSMHASEAEVLQGLLEYMKRRDAPLKPYTCYRQAIVAFSTHVNRNNPENRR